MHSSPSDFSHGAPSWPKLAHLHALTLIVDAAHSGDVRAVDALLAVDAALNLRDEWGRTALHFSTARSVPPQATRAHHTIFLTSERLNPSDVNSRKSAPLSIAVVGSEAGRGSCG